MITLLMKQNLMKSLESVDRDRGHQVMFQMEIYMMWGNDEPLQTIDIHCSGIETSIQTEQVRYSGMFCNLPDSSYKHVAGHKSHYPD